MTDRRHMQDKFWFERGARDEYHVWKKGKCYGTVYQMSFGGWTGYVTRHSNEDQIQVGKGRGLRTRKEAAERLYKYLS